MAGETDILEALLSSPSRIALPAGAIGPGDDAAVLPASQLGGQSLVLTCDALEEGVHFLPGWMSWEDLAHKLVAVNLSDLAAMGAEPLGILVALAWPEGLEEEPARALSRAMQDACARWSCPLLGGDTDVRRGALRLEATAVGRCDRPVRRSTARAGDRLFVTGPLGGAAAAVDRWLTGASEGGDAAEADAFMKFRRPEPRLDAARVLRSHATAMIDLSDGLQADLERLAAASGVAARVRMTDIPLHPAVPAARARQLAVEGGEDYELLVAGDAAMARAWPGLVEVGELVSGEPGLIDFA